MNTYYLKKQSDGTFHLLMKEDDTLLYINLTYKKGKSIINLLKRSISPDIDILIELMLNIGLHNPD
jgi:hypothetical protein